MSFERIIVVDPAMYDKFGNPSKNSGDIIISQSVKKVLFDIFPDSEIISIPSHTFPDKNQVNLVRESKLCFIGGSNLLQGNIEDWNQWNYPNKRRRYFFSKTKFILLGPGWNTYSSRISIQTKLFYSNILNSKFAHSVRDEYSKEKLSKAFNGKVLNTSCPTTWELEGRNADRSSPKINECIFTLTLWRRNEEDDTNLIKSFFDLSFKQIHFFPQGIGDLEYLQNLKIYQNNKDKFNILNGSILTYDQVLKNNEEVVFIGTRLHGGVRALQKGVDTLILAVDNRAKEINKDINIPVIERNDTQMLYNWVLGKTNFGKISLPINAIGEWKKQFFQ